MLMLFAAFPLQALKLLQIREPENPKLSLAIINNYPMSRTSFTSTMIYYASLGRFTRLAPLVSKLRSTSTDTAQKLNFGG